MKKIFQFKKSKLPIMKIAFWALIFGSLLSILSIFIQYPYNFTIKALSAPLEEITVNFSLKQRQNLDLLVCFEDYCISPEADNFNNVYTARLTKANAAFYEKKINKINIAYRKKTDVLLKDRIDHIDLHIGNKNYYFSADDISKFHESKTKINLDESDKPIDCRILSLTDNIKNNYGGVFNHLNVLFLSLFYNWKFLIIPYFWLFIAFLLYNFNREEINIKLPNKTYPILIGLTFVLGVLLRINHFNYYPFWFDEVYTKTVAAISFKGCFSDPGNPPFFFFLEYLISKFSNTETALRLLPFVFGCLFPVSVYFLFKNINKNLALFGAFFAAVNTINIYHSTEARCYSLAMLLVVLMIYYQFKWFKDFKRKDIIIYSILSVFAINTHFMLAIFTASSFLWNLFGILDKKFSEKQAIKPYLKDFLISQSVVFMSFLPYLIMTFKNSVKNGFNGWIEPLSTHTFKYIIDEFFINKYIFLALSIVVLVLLIFSFIPQKWLSKINLEKNKDKETLFLFLVYSIIFVLTVSCIISIFVKPILHKRILLALYSLLFLIETVSISTIFDFKKLNKKMLTLKVTYSLILTLICFSITKPMPLRDIYRYDPFLNFVQNDAPKYHDKDYKIHVITNGQDEYWSHYPKIKEMDYIKMHYVDANAGEYITEINSSDYIGPDKKVVIYIVGLAGDVGKISSLNPFAYVYKTNLAPNHFAKLIYHL